LNIALFKMPPKTKKAKGQSARQNIGVPLPPDMPNPYGFRDKREKASYDHTVLCCMAKGKLM
jgi:hypothetical protein